jgi:hypothetical protein
MNKSINTIGYIVCAILILILGVIALNGMIWLGSNMLRLILLHPLQGLLTLTALLLFYSTYLHLTEK